MKGKKTIAAPKRKSDQPLRLHPTFKVKVLFIVSGQTSVNTEQKLF